MAGRLGRTVRELLLTMDSAELTDWMAWSVLGSRSEQVADMHAASLAAMTYNANRGKDQPPMKVEKFVLYRGTVQRQPMTAQRARAILDGIKSMGSPANG